MTRLTVIQSETKGNWSTEFEGKKQKIIDTTLLPRGWRSDPIPRCTKKRIEAKKKKWNITSESRTEESVKEMGDPVGKVLKEIDPGKSRFSSNPTLAFSILNPKGHPSSCWAITGWDCGGWFDILRNVRSKEVAAEEEVHEWKTLNSNH